MTDEMDARKFWRKHFENLHYVGSNEEVIVNVCGLDGLRRNMYLGDEAITREEVIGVRKLKNGKSAGIDGMTGEMIKNGGKRVIEWIWKLLKKLLWRA